MDDRPAAATEQTARKGRIEQTARRIAKEAEQSAPNVQKRLSNQLCMHGLCKILEEIKESRKNLNVRRRFLP